MRTIRTPENEAAFLEALSETGNVTASYQAARISKRAVYDWYRDDEAFRIKWEEALLRGVGALEDEVMRRAKEGTDEPVFYQGAQCGAVRRYSDTLAIFLLKANRRDKYGDQARVEHSGNLTVTTVSYADAAEDSASV